MTRSVETFRFQARQRGHLRAAASTGTTAIVSARCISSKVGPGHSPVVASGPRAPAFAREGDASCNTDIDPKPSKSTLMMPRSCNRPCPCATTDPGIEAFSSGTDGTELSLADDHAARMLSEMTRQSRAIC